MALLLPGNGEQIALQLLVNKIATPENLVLHLYTNNHTPGASDTVGSYTEASGSGYSSVTLTGASWNVSGSNPATIAYAQQTFTFTGALGNVYGYYMTRASTADIVLAELFSNGPYLVQNNGDQIKVTPQITAT